MSSNGSVTANTNCTPVNEVPTKRRKQNSISKTKNIENVTTTNTTSVSQSAFHIPFAFMPNQSAVASSTLCTLRFDLLMSLNEAKVDKLCVPDRIHRFVWCLDACVRNRRIDSRHASELAYHLQLQRRRWARNLNVAEIQDNFEQNENDPDYVYNDSSSKRDGGGTVRSKIAKGAGSNSNKMNQKKISDENDGESTNLNGLNKEENILERYF